MGSSPCPPSCSPSRCPSWPNSDGEGTEGQGDAVLTGHTIAFGLALALALGLTPLMGAIAMRLGAVSEVGGRNVNTRVVPRLGGVAVAVATLVPLLLLFLQRNHAKHLDS